MQEFLAMQQMQQQLNMNQMGMQPIGMQQQPPQQQGHSTMNQGAADNVHTASDPNNFGFGDDKQRISTSYNAIGLAWMHGEKRVSPKKFRASLYVLHAIDTSIPS